VIDMAANATWSSSLPAETEVLIVGAGPAGMTLSASLCLLGVDHVMVDRNVAVQPGTKAAAVQPRTLEYLDRLGVADPLIADGVRGTGFLVRDADR
jgi:2-polyprenyl-6-methoxyphenol hydroxylase-like FAD-dependent oxidoreductase